MEELAWDLEDTLAFEGRKIWDSCERNFWEHPSLLEQGLFGIDQTHIIIPNTWEIFFFPSLIFIPSIPHPLLLLLLLLLQQQQQHP